METIVKYAYEVYKKGNFTTAYFAKEAEAAGYCATVESVTKGGELPFTNTRMLKARSAKCFVNKRKEDTTILR